MTERFLEEADPNYSATDFKVLSHQSHHPSDPCSRPAGLDVRLSQPEDSSVSTSFSSVHNIRNPGTPFETPFRRPLDHNDFIGDRSPHSYPDNEPDIRSRRYQFDDSSNPADVNELKHDTHDIYHGPRPHRPRPIEAPRGFRPTNGNHGQHYHRNTHEPRPRVKPYGPRPMGSLPHGVNPCHAASHDVVQSQLGSSSVRSWDAYPHQHNTSLLDHSFPNEDFGGHFGDGEQADNKVRSSPEYESETMHTEWTPRGQRHRPNRCTTFTDSNYQRLTHGEPCSSHESARRELNAASMPRVRRQARENTSGPNRHSRDALRDIRQ